MATKLGGAHVDRGLTLVIRPAQVSACGLRTRRATRRDVIPWRLMTTLYDSAMSKRISVNLSDDLHAQVKERAEAANLSAHAWILAALQRESFRQMCQEANQWWKDHPEAAEQHLAEYHEREALKARAAGGRDSSAA